MSTTSLRRRERSSSPESRENDTSPTRKRSSSPFDENENITGDESGEKRCKCYSCSKDGQPYDVDRNWSIRFFGKSKEYHDMLIRLLDESVEDTDPEYSFTDSWEECSYTPTDPIEIVDAYPSEIVKSPATNTESSDGSGINEVVIAVRRDSGAVQDDGQTRNDGQGPHLVSDVDSSPPRND